MTAEAQSKTEDLEERRQEFFQALDAGTLTIPQSVRLLRQTTGMTIPEYAKHIGVSERYLGDIERGLKNPTVDILEKIGEPLDLVVCFRKRPPN